MNRGAAIAAVLLALCAAPAWPWRDPLAPPVLAAPASATAAAPAAAAPAHELELPTLRHLVTVDGTRYVVVGARRLAVGERWGALRIECIHERGVFVRDAAGSRRHLPLLASLPASPAMLAQCPPPKAPTTLAQRTAKRTSP